MYSSLIAWIMHYNTVLFYSINLGMENGFLNTLMPDLTNFGSFIAWGIICGLIYLFGGSKSKQIAILGLAALILGNAVVYVLKYVVAEPRPFLVLGNVHQLVPESEVYSFPSGHSASSFAVATVLGLKYSLNFKNKRFRLIYPLIAFAALIGFSRVYIGVHYPLDVVFGALIGILSALTVLRLEDNIFNGKISRMIYMDKLVNLDILGYCKKLVKNRN